MRRGSHDMQVNVAGLRRNLKNFAHNYSDAQKKVREATSNDPWGPSSTLMAEIADLTYNVVAFTEIMQMVWKRLNDHGRNWRHVYKALVLLEYLIKTGSEKVGQQCKENIFAIQTLRDFQYLEEGKDQGQNVREKAKQLVNLLKDDEKLKNERARALKAKERFAQSASAFGSDTGIDTPTSPRFPAFRGDWSGSRDAAKSVSVDLPREIENARPQTAGEEELQLQLALAMSREEAEQEEQKRKSDDVRLQLALSQSQQDFKNQEKKQGHMVDLLDVNLGDATGVQLDPWGMPAQDKTQSSTWHDHTSPNHVGNAASADPWTPAIGQAAKTESWVVPSSANILDSTLPPRPKESETKNDPWSPASQSSSTDLDDFDLIMNRNRSPQTVQSNVTVSNNNGDPFELSLLGDSLPETQTAGSATGVTKKTPQSFLGENSSLVNLDNLVMSKTANPQGANPFQDQPPRPVFNTTPVKPSMNEIKQASFAPFTAPAPVVFPSPGQYALGPSLGNGFGPNYLTVNQTVQDPWTPVQSTTNSQSPWTKANEPANPFLS
ncbi:epsin-2 isoform X2 [Coccinella septempunctata]|uniref:epsin-2 isoform X2 n=1 Tax=Coccinella septempunctata TaxID=41139 RepID=UPI001D096770|nr:epsin-2 isoform X2 [Coccinella septempunctata]